MRNRTGSHLAVALAAAAVTLGAAGAPTSAADTTGRIELFAGQRSLDSEFEPADDATQFGLALSIGRPGWPVAIAFDVMQGSDDAEQATTAGGFPVTANVDVDVNEIDLGVRRTRGDGAWRWYYGGGAAFVDVEAESKISDSGGTLFSGEESDDAVGLWLNVGASWLFAERFQAGIDLRHTEVDVDLGETEFDAGGLQVGLTLGYRW